ncbi:hypothetical protein BT96DRAFT_920145 [Gymnopus androsaceus JB14]|uniref:HNH nuclease domain-containing protein n=1 Tax=Gymnopus androsaceus JB14 TaxID=1447944 RepID=A0A6A4HKT8_9AGAR|nr:hypothetical protein BT96DRAFT_920145 [Gymnopus androsaceus JB14]
MVQIGSSEEKSDYGVYTSFHTWRPPTRDEVPSHWFTASSPKVAPSTRPAWTRRSMGHRADMRSYMSEKAKTSDEFKSTTVKGGHAVPVDEKVFYAERQLAQQLYPRDPFPVSLVGDQQVHDIRNFITLSRQVQGLWDTYILVFYPLSPGLYFAYFLAEGDGYANSYHLAKLSLSERTDPYLLFYYCGSPPTDALPDLSPLPTKHKTPKEGPLKRKRRTSDDNMDAEGDGDGMSTGEEAEEDGPMGFKRLFEDAEAQGMELSEDLEDLVGSYHPDRKRIAQTATECLSHNPAVGIPPDSVLSYNVFHIS